MAQGLTPTSRAQLLGGLLATGVVAPLVVVGSVGLEVQAQEQQLPPSSQQVDRPGITPAEPAGEPQVLVSEVLVKGLEGHPDRDRLERAVYDSLTVRPGATTSRSAIKADLDAIYATGWFSDVRVQPSDGPLGVRLVVTVSPNPVLTEVVLNNPKALLPASEISEVFATDYGRTLNLKTLERRVKELQKWYSPVRATPWLGSQGLPASVLKGWWSSPFVRVWWKASRCNSSMPTAMQPMKTARRFKARRSLGWWTGKFRCDRVSCLTAAN